MEKRHPRGLPLLDPEEDLHISDSAFRKAQRCASVLSNSSSSAMSTVASVSLIQPFAGRSGVHACDSSTKNLT